MNRTLCVTTCLLLACAKPPRVDYTNVIQPGANRLEGKVEFPTALPAGTRVQVALSQFVPPTLGTASASKAVDLTAPSQTVDFSFSALSDGDVTVQVIAYRPEVMQAMKDLVVKGQEDFKKTGQRTTLPSIVADVGDHAGFLSDEPEATLEPTKAKTLTLSKGTALTGLTLRARRLEPFAPPAGMPALVAKILGSKNKVRPFNDWDSGRATLEGLLGPPTQISGKRFAWGFIDGDTCTFTYIEKEDRSRYFKDQPGTMVGAYMEPQQVKREGNPDCVAAAGAGPQ